MENRNPLISVVMPVFNAEEYIDQAITSILSQTFPYFELIIINDASTDRTMEKVKNYHDDRIKVITNNKNLNLADSLNKGIELAIGKYIARMDGDDIAHPNRLEAQYNILEHNSDIVLVASYIETFSHSPKISNEDLLGHQNWWNRGITDSEIRSLLPLGNCLNHPSVMFRKKAFFESGKYKSEYNCAEDYDLFLRLKGNFIKIPYPLLKYRIHPNQISQRLRAKQRMVDAEIKADYIKSSFGTKERKIIIWGASNGGKLIYDALKKRKMNIIGFIDKNQEIWGSKINGTEVLGNEDILDNLDFDFIIIASSGGRIYATEYLSNRGLKFGKDFLPVWA